MEYTSSIHHEHLGTWYQIDIRCCSWQDVRPICTAIDAFAPNDAKDDNRYYIRRIGDSDNMGSYTYRYVIESYNEDDWKRAESFVSKIFQKHVERLKSEGFLMG